MYVVWILGQKEYFIFIIHVLNFRQIRKEKILL